LIEVHSFFKGEVTEVDVTQTHCDQNQLKYQLFTHLTIDMHLVHGILRIL